jgi:sn1-specific diacylglycerol lipase
MTGDPLVMGAGTAVAFRVNHEGGQRPVYEPKFRQVLSRTNESDRQVMAEGARFARPALVIYTWVLYIYMHPLTGGCRILGRGGCCILSSDGRDTHTDDCPYEEERMDAERFSSRHGRDIDPELGERPVRDETGERMENRHTIIGDNCCQVHKSALLLHAGLEDSDLVYAQLKSSFTETPYCILLDHRWKTVVVAIRGTLSLEDCVTDVLLDPEPLDDLGREFGFDAEGEFCHRYDKHEHMGLSQCVFFAVNCISYQILLVYPTQRHIRVCPIHLPRFKKVRQT